MAKPKTQTVYAVFGMSYEESDGYQWPDYEYLSSDIYESEEAAEAECSRLCAFFYSIEDPTPFANPDILPDADDNWTWEQIRACPQWNEPFKVTGLNIHPLPEIS